MKTRILYENNSDKFKKQKLNNVEDETNDSAENERERYSKLNIIS